MRLRPIILLLSLSVAICSCSALRQANSAAWDRTAQMHASQRGYDSEIAQGTPSSTYHQTEGLKRKVREKVNATVDTPDRIDQPKTPRDIRKRERAARGGEGDQIVNYASNYLGRPYCWGGTGPNSFDCSGFVLYVYKHFGYDLPRVAGDQFNSGKKVGVHHLKPGDLVVFARGGYIFHVGIVTETDGNTFSFIHASSSGVMINRSDDSYWSRYYYGASRVI